MDWIQLAQNSVEGQVLVDMIGLMNNVFHKGRGIS